MNYVIQQLLKIQMPNKVMDGNIKKFVDCYSELLWS